MRNLSCADCHGGAPLTTTSAEAKSPKAGYIGVPTKADVPIAGTGCHANVANMRRYYLPMNQYAKYLARSHSVRLPECDEILAICYNCHSGHQLLKANVPASSVYPSRVPGTRADCYADKVLMAPYEITMNLKTSDICHKLLGTIVTSM
jgi:hypothetical protein